MPIKSPVFLLMVIAAGLAGVLVAYAASHGMQPRARNAAAPMTAAEMEATVKQALAQLPAATAAAPTTAEAGNDPALTTSPPPAPDPAVQKSLEQLDCVKKAQGKVAELQRCVQR